MRSIVSKSLIVVLAAVLPALVISLVPVEPAYSGGCKLYPDNYTFDGGGMYCWYRYNYNCYQCWYYNEPTDDYSYCAESPDGTVQNCGNFGELTDTPDP